MRKNWAIAVALSIVLCSFTACNTASVNTEIDSDGSYEFVYTESTAEEEQTSSEEIEENTDEVDEEVSDVLENIVSEEIVSEEESVLPYESVLENGSDILSSGEESSDTDTQSSEFIYEGVSVQLPEGFKVDDSDGPSAVAYFDNGFGSGFDMYYGVYSNISPEKSDNISFTKTNESIALYSKDNINKTMKTIFDDYKGCKNYKQYKINDFDAVYYEQTLKINNADEKQTCLAIFEEKKTVLITFISVTGTYDEFFKKSVESVKVVE